MASAKIIAPDRIYKNGHSALILQITVDGIKYRRTIVSIPYKFIDRKNKEVRGSYGLDSIKLNRTLKNTLADAQTYIYDCQEKKRPVDPESYFKTGTIRGNLISHVEAKRKAMIADGRGRTGAKYQTVINDITDSKMDVSVHDITDGWITRFDKWLLKQGNNNNTRAGKIGALGSVMELAKKNRVIDFNPFDTYTKSSNVSQKAKLNMEEFRRLQVADIKGRAGIARSMFVFATLARGMRAYDVLTLRWTNIKEGRLLYVAQKAPKQKEGRRFDISMSDQMHACLEGLDMANEYVFPFVTMPFRMLSKDKDKYLQHVNSKNTLVNKLLGSAVKSAGIDKHITFHSARHTFAYISDQKNIPLGTIQQLLGHSKLSTTLGYVQSLRSSDELDEAVKDVF